MIISDTNIISSFAITNNIQLLRKALQVQIIFVSPAVYQELNYAIEAGCDFLEEIVDAIESKNGFKILPLSYDEILALSKLPSSLGAGEKECISLCLHRKENILLTNDKRARNFCKDNNLPCLDISSILRLLWKDKICDKNDIEKIILEMEEKEGMVFKNKRNIFKK